MIITADQKFVSEILRNILLSKLKRVFDRVDGKGQPSCARYNLVSSNSIEQALTMTVESFPEATHIKTAVKTWADMCFTDRAIIIDHFRKLFAKMHAEKSLNDTTKAFVQIFMQEFVPLLNLQNN